MKTLSTLAVTDILLISLSSCKKSTSHPQQKIIVSLTNITKSTTYIIKITDKTIGGEVLSLTGGETDDTASFTADPGDALSVHYSFTTTGSQYGQGTLDITCSGSTLLHSDGGYSDNYSLTVTK
jgi:hypothetical protein